MKFFMFVICIVFLFLEIENNNLLSFNGIKNKEKRESYEACIKLRSKAPNFNLKCEKLIENNKIDDENNKIEEINNTKIKTLSFDESGTRKVNKSEEMKLRNLIKKLSNENKLRKN